MGLFITSAADQAAVDVVLRNADAPEDWARVDEAPAPGP